MSYCIIDPIEVCNSGDILKGQNNQNIYGIPPHPIIFLSSIPGNYEFFYGAMLTHSNRFKENLAMEKRHFLAFDKMGQPFEVIYEKTLVVQKLFYKKVEWGPFAKVGELSKDGLDFVLSKVAYLTPEFFKHNALS